MRTALALKRLAYTSVPVHLVKGGGEQHAGAYVDGVNALAQVPALRFVDGATGEATTLTQSLAIIELLDELEPGGGGGDAAAAAPPRLLPRDPRARARAREIAELVNAGAQPLQNLAHVKAIDAAVAAAGGVKQGAGRAVARAAVERALGALERLVARSDGPFCVGDAPTVADVCVVPQLYNARRFDVEVTPERFPALLRVEAACAVHPAFIEAHPDNQPDADPNA